MWGTRRLRDAALDNWRFIPTHVGNTDALPGSARRPSVHPHACGEHPGSLRPLAYTHGSSPRMWGTLAAKPEAARTWRFIPTHVGNTAQLPGASSPGPVHPHACGEHCSEVMLAIYVRGSSPRMWGTRSVSYRWCGRCRFIPTHVGNTNHQNEPHNRKPVHPHACGEHYSMRFWLGSSYGSSPRMWGTLLLTAFVDADHRFIPTHVGNTG